MLDRVLHKRVLFDYPDPKDRADPDARLEASKDFIAGWFAGIHGHFAAGRHLRSHRGAKFLATLRHPVERILSQFAHEYNEQTPDAPWHQQIVSGEMDVVDFASQDGVRNAMSCHLKGLDSSDYDLLLVTERLNLSFHLLNYVLGNLDIPAHYGDPPQIPLVNGSSERTALLHFDEWTRQRVFSLAEEDVDLYMRANERLERMAKRYLR